MGGKKANTSFYVRKAGLILKPFQNLHYFPPHTLIGLVMGISKSLKGFNLDPFNKVITLVPWPI
jgi:hypothetical protein